MKPVSVISENLLSTMGVTLGSLRGPDPNYISPLLGTKLVIVSLKRFNSFFFSFSHNDGTKIKVKVEVEVKVTQQ